MEKIEKIMFELNELQDPTLPKNIDIHCFEMKKAGKGWKTVGYVWSNTGILDPYQTSSESVLKNHGTLAKIKADFVCPKSYDAPRKSLPCDNYFACAIDGHLTAPSTIFQLIVECQSSAEFEAVRQILTLNQGLNYTCLLNYTWVDQISPGEVKRLMEF